ncbi:hypothetical protein NCAS_0A15310 [Naumovozyma castellii]|uniref:DNA-directed RNA polymerase III subunit RPC3 n=1 Tax=Naumovozyma castellii TaxID=27288 RepID=G0V9D8_NAUCA|nr:hypothetical protein NCAS_0A15310 [Naumovozyma castellii CBS 4309]CCC68089.1 hypothetical protein NCAS_0A15310 [Naumovozyma castellii CBS 4309]
MESILNSVAAVAPTLVEGSNSVANEANTAAVGEDQPIDVSSLEQRTLTPERFLYVELVKSNLGERAAKIIDLLLSLGRLTVHEIAVKAPDFNVKIIKATLVSLIQLRCVKYLDEVSLSGKKSTYYYYNEDGLILCLYSGLIIEELNNYLPQRSKTDPESSLSLAAQVVQNILTLGSVTLRDYLEDVQPPQLKHELTATFVTLCESGFLVPLTKLNYTPINDLWHLLYEKEYKTIPRTSTLSDLKKRAEAKAKAKAEFQKFLSLQKDPKNMITTDPETSLKTVIKTIPLTVNLDRFLKVRRTKQLSQFAKARINSYSAQVYKVALKMTEQKSPDLIDPLTKTGLLQELDEALGIKEELELAEEKTPGITFNAMDVAKYLPASVDLRGTLTSQTTNKRSQTDSNTSNGKRLKTEDGFVIPKLPHIAEDPEQENEEDFDENDNDPHSIALINSHLKLLASSNTPFLQETKPGVYYVPYSKLIPILKTSTYDYIILSTLGPSAMRIRRCISSNGLVSEKVITQKALMKEKDIRSTISSLVKYNVVEIQEVPRTADRAAARAVFLFSTNENHAYGFMKQNLAWNIANLLFKKESLRAENVTLLTKANRDDVKGKEEELLLPSELNQLKMVNERELNSFSRISRLLSLWEVFKMC